MLLCSHCCGIGPRWQIEGSNDSETFMTSVSSGAGDVSPFFQLDPDKVHRRNWRSMKKTKRLEKHQEMPLSEWSVQASEAKDKIMPFTSCTTQCATGYTATAPSLTLWHKDHKDHEDHEVLQAFLLVWLGLTILALLQAVRKKRNKDCCLVIWAHFAALLNFPIVTQGAVATEGSHQQR